MKRLDARQTQRLLREPGLDSSRGAGFAFRDRSGDVVYDWHSHDHHQLLYAFSGTAQLEAGGIRFFLPPQRAAWIPAGVRHRTWFDRVESGSIYFSPRVTSLPADRVRILAAPPVMREMVGYAMRWPVGAAEADPLAQRFFETLALLCQEWVLAEMPFYLPSSQHPAIVRAMDYAQADLANATQAGALRAAGLSERTFRRMFRRETGMSWQAYVGQSRMVAAMAALAERQARVTDVAAGIGFESLSAFAKAFTRFAGESPSRYRRRVAMFPASGPP
ncbi:MAG: helix-turn-helix transcriptional regulator [Alphaproteobacteria bacterium]